MKINPTSPQNDFSFGSISRENTATFSRVNTTAKEGDFAAIDFKNTVGEEDYNLIIESLRCFPKDLTHTRLEFKVHDETKRIMVKVYDKTSAELISEIPPEKFLDLIAELWIQAGLIVDKKV